MCVFGEGDRVGEAGKTKEFNQLRRKETITRVAANRSQCCHSNHVIDIFIFPAFVLGRCGQTGVLRDMRG